MTATASEIADALSGRTGPVVIRFRYEERDHNFQFVNDLTQAFSSGSIELDNKRAVVRTASFVLDPDELPDGFDIDDAHVAVIAQLLVNGEFEPIPMGMFHLDAPREEISSLGVEMTVEASDLCVHLLQSKLEAPLLIPTGDTYVEHIEAQIEAAIPGDPLSHNIEASAETIPVDFIFGPGESRYDVITALCKGINYFPPFADAEGGIVSRRRSLPSASNTNVLYSTESEPRMLEAPASIAADITRFANRIVVLNDHPDRQGFFMIRVNNDPLSPISIVSQEGIVNTDSTIEGSRVVDIDMAEEIAEYEIEDRAALSRQATIRTLFDPRRGPQEYVGLTLDDREVDSSWRVEGWRVDLNPGAVMEHRLSRAQAIEQSIEVALTGTVLTADESDIVAGGRTIILALNNEVWDDPVAGLLVWLFAFAGAPTPVVEPDGWNTEMVPLIDLPDIVLTSASVITVTLDAAAGYDIVNPETVRLRAALGGQVVGDPATYTNPAFTIVPV